MGFSCKTGGRGLLFAAVDLGAGCDLSESLKKKTHCSVATDAPTCRGMSRCSFRLRQTRQLEHAWALPHKGAPRRRPINLPKASKGKEASVGPWVWCSGARGQGVLGRLRRVSLGLVSNAGGLGGTGWCPRALYQMRGWGWTPGRWEVRGSAFAPSRV